MGRMNLRGLGATLVLAMLGIGFVTAAAFSLVLYRTQTANAMDRLVDTTAVAMSPIVNLATRGVNGGNLMKLRGTDAQALYDSSNALYLYFEGTSEGQEKTVFAAAVPPQPIKYEYVREGVDASRMRRLATGTRTDWRLDEESWTYTVRWPLAEVTNGGEVVAVYSAESMQGLVWRTVSDVTLVSLGIFSVALVVVFFVGRWISSPVIRMAAQIRNIIDTLDLRQRVEVTAKNEVGDTARVFNTLLDKFQSILAEVGESTTQVAVAADELAEAASGTSTRARAQEAQTQHVVTAITELKAAVDEVTANTSAAAESATSAGQESASGRDVVRLTTQEVNDVAQGVDAATQVIRRLGVEAENIGGVLDVIRGIAEQTNLLALNAAIEAARAGESGRGFAVVADEVRTLASRTQKSTEEINNMIARLQTGTRDAIAAMAREQERVRSCVERAELAATSLDAITASVSTITEMNGQIAVSVEEQSSVAEEINRNMVQIGDLAVQSASDADKTAQYSAEMSRLAVQLKSLAGQFQV